MAMILQFKGQLNTFFFTLIIKKHPSDWLDVNTTRVVCVVGHIPHHSTPACGEVVIEDWPFPGLSGGRMKWSLLDLKYPTFPRPWTLTCVGQVKAQGQGHSEPE